MDKYEFNIKVEQIKKLVNKGDYETAMKIADTVDWKRVRSTSLLSMIAQVYERNEEYQEAKDILLLAFERAPIGKRLLFKLTELALKEGNVDEAEAYYREFCDLAEEDPREHLLRYMILEAKGAPPEQLVISLERYTTEELDEKWLYKLAELYQQQGREEDCVAVCDKIMLLFGLGKYVDQAMELKLQYAPLTTYQMDLVENRDKYEAKLRAVEQKFDKNGNAYQEPAEEEYEEVAGEAPQVDSELVARLHEAEAEKSLAKEMSRISAEDMEPETQEYMEETRVLGNIRDIKEYRDGLKPQRPETLKTDSEAAMAATESAAGMELSSGSDRASLLYDEAGGSDPRGYAPATIPEVVEDTSVEDWDVEPEPVMANHLMIEAQDPDAGFKLAVESLKKVHRELGTKHPVAKITGEKLNQKGIFSIIDKLAGKDLIVECAADLSDQVLDELNELMERDATGIIVVLIDAPARIEYLHNQHPGLADKFQCIGCDSEPLDSQDLVIGQLEAQKSLEKQTERLAREAASQERISRDANRQGQEWPGQEMAGQDWPGRETAEQEQEQMSRESAARQEQEWLSGEAARQEQERPSRESAARQGQERPSRESVARQGQERLSREAAQREQMFREDAMQEQLAREAARQERLARDAAMQERLPREEDARLSRVSSHPQETDSKGKSSAKDYDDSNQSVGMDVESFAQYACKYALEIDCSITGKSLLALYERVEMMDEDGVLLTKEEAEDLIEEAADKAEKPSFISRIKNLFSPKYDKDGLLILKEQHFFD